jgi:hypothetical protein
MDEGKFLLQLARWRMMLKKWEMGVVMDDPLRSTT